MDKPFRRILLIKMRFHGDMLLTTPVISSLKKNYPDAKIDVLLYQDTIPILSENPEINALYGIKNKKAKASEKIANFFHLIKVLRANKYDLIVNLTDQWMVAILVRLLNARVKISQDYHHRQSAFWRKSFTHLVPLQGGNVVESNLSVLTRLQAGNVCVANLITLVLDKIMWLSNLRRGKSSNAGTTPSFPL